MPIWRKKKISKELQNIKSEYSKSQYHVLKMNERVATADKTVERLVEDLSNAKKNQNELELKIKELQLEVRRKEESYEKLENTCYDQMRDMSEKMSANMTKVKEARELNASATPAEEHEKQNLNINESKPEFKR